MHSSTNETQTLSAGGGLHHTDRFCKALLIWVLCVKTLLLVLSNGYTIGYYFSQRQMTRLCWFSFFSTFSGFCCCCCCCCCFLRVLVFWWVFFCFILFFGGFFLGGVFVCVCFLFCLFVFLLLFFFWGGCCVCLWLLFFLFVCLLFFFLFGKEGGVVAFEIIILAPLQDQFRVEIVRKNTCVD